MSLLPPTRVLSSYTKSYSLFEVLERWDFSKCTDNISYKIPIFVTVKSYPWGGKSWFLTLILCQINQTYILLIHTLTLIYHMTKIYIVDTLYFENKPDRSVKKNQFPSSNRCPCKDISNLSTKNLSFTVLEWYWALAEVRKQNGEYAEWTRRVCCIRRIKVRL